MFESALLEQSSTKSRALTFAAMTGQLALAGLIVLIPLLNPAVIQTFTRQNNVPLVPLRPLANVEVTSSSSSVAQPLVIIDKIFRKPLVAPMVINPVVTFIDDLGTFIPSNHTSTSLSSDRSGIGGSPFGNTIETAAPPPPPAKVQVAPEPKGPVAIGGKVQEAKLIKRVVPLYPPLARQARVQGIVRLQGIIAKDGTIQELQVLSGHPLLVRSAVDAVSQWVYAPTQLNGHPVVVICPIDVIFTLSQ